RLLKDAQDRQHEEQAATRRGQVGSGERAEKIRTYNFPQNRVTDHRVKVDRRLQDVLAGDLDPIVDELLAEERRRQLSGSEHGGWTLMRPSEVIVRATRNLDAHGVEWRREAAEVVPQHVVGVGRG